jgi:uncharacterized membrane protein YfcA
VPPDLTVDPSIAALAIAMMVGAGIIKGTIGFGAPLVAVPALALLVGPKPAIILVSVPLLVTNALILTGRPIERGAGRRFVPVLVTLVPATFVGSLFLTAANPAILAAAVGVVTIVFVLLSFLGVQLQLRGRSERVFPFALGAFAGLCNGSTSIPGPTFALYLSTLKLDKRAFVWGITLLLVVGNASQVTSYLHLDLYAGGLLLGSAALAPALLVGQQLGVRIQDRLDGARFNRLVLIAVGISGTSLLVRSLV